MVVSAARPRHLTHRPTTPAPAFSVSSTDAALRIEPAGPTSFTIRGVTSSTTAAVVLTVGGKPIRVRLHKGMAPEAVATTIRRSLQRTHDVKVEGLAYRPGPGQRMPFRVTVSTREPR